MNPTKFEYIPRYTYEDFLQWEGHWELINGIAYAMSPQPSIEDQIISGNIHHQLINVLKNCSQCRPLLPVDWKIDEQTVVQPDNLVVCGPVEGKFLTQTPSVIFEILSASTAFKDRNVKYEIYQNLGVKYYILVDSDHKEVEVNELINKKYSKIKDIPNMVFIFKLEPCQFDFNFNNIWQP